MLRRHYPPNASSALHDSSSSEDEEEMLLHEEQEQERLLTEQHGEANEALPSSNSNKRQSDADIANALNSTDAVKKKKPRMTLTSSKLTGPEGLIRIRHDFNRIKYRIPKLTKAMDRKVAKKKQFDREIHSSAVYMAKIMQAYQEFASDIAPNMHYSDTFIKIRDMGSKKEVRDYLNVMRQEVCKDHLEKIYGKDKAEKFVDEFENGIQSRGGGEDEFLHDNYQDYGAGVAQRLATLENSEIEKEDKDTASSNSKNVPLASREDNSDDDDDDENEASFDDVAPSQIVARNKDPDTDSIGTAANIQDPSNTDILSNNENGVDETNVDDNELEEPQHEDSTEEPRAGDDSLEEPSSDVSSEELEEPVAESKVLGIRAGIDEEEISPLKTQDASTQDAPITQDAELNTDTTGIVEFSQSQGSVFGEAHSQEKMTQDTMVFDASQTQESTQDTLVINVSQTQNEQMVTQDTLVIVSSQDTGGSKAAHEESGSQDY